MKLETSFDSAIWYIKYFGLPLTIGVTMFGLLGVSRRKRRLMLEGKVVVITGASSGIGEALAHVFYEYGSKVVLAARRESELHRVKQDLLSKKTSNHTLEPIVVRLDLAEIGSLEQFVQQVYDKCGNIDVLINNGGVSFRGSILHTKIEVDKQLMFINYLGPVALTKAVLPKMVENKCGHIVFVSSVQGLIAIPDRSAYAAAKHATQAFADSLRAELHQHNIDVSVMSPGYIKTAVSMNALTGSGEQHAVMDTATAAGFAPEYCAEKIVDMVVKKEKESVLSQFLPKLAIFVRHSMPSLYFLLMAKRAQKS